jgi:IS1 family transposase
MYWQSARAASRVFWFHRLLLAYLPEAGIYHQVQVDERYSFVQSKKRKGWILYAYYAQTKETATLTMGKRSKKTIKDLYKRLRSITVNFWCRDAWPVFREVIPADSDLIGKGFTKVVEDGNTCKRLICKTTTFSEKVYNHGCALKLVMHHRNLIQTYI